MSTIRFHFDFISPYAYLAWTQLHPLAERCGARVEPAPVLFAGLLGHHGQKGPAEIPAKRIYVLEDTLRRARLLGVPLALPPTHPFNPLVALRAVLAAGEDRRRALIDGLFAATWGGASELGVEHPETVARVAGEAGLDGRALVERAGSAEIKDALRASTDEAIAAGVFGVPTVRTESGALFWGLDSFDLVERHLRGEDPLTPEMRERIRSLRASATRAR